MPIQTSLASSAMKPGSSAEFNLTAGARGLVGFVRTIGLIGMRRSTGSKAQATLSQIFTEGDADAYFGNGSELALMCRAAISAGKASGFTPAIWAVPMDAPGGGTAATYTMTVTGPATAAGDVVFRVAGRTLRATVANGDSATTVAAAIVAAIQANPKILPCSAANVAGVVTVTFNHKGVSGNDLKISVVFLPAGLACAVAAGAAGAGVYVASTALNVLYDKRYFAVALSNHLAQDVTDAKAYVDARNALTAKAWSMVYIAENGSLATAQALTAAANYKDVVGISAENFPSLPGEIAAWVAAYVESKSDAAYNFDGTEMPGIYLPDPTDIPTDAEVQTALSTGTTILSWNYTQDRPTIVRLVTSLTTIGGVAYQNLVDASNVRAMFETAAQVDVAVSIAMKGAKKNARTKNRMKSVALSTLRKLEEIEVVQNVDAHVGELQCEDDPVVSTRLNLAVPTSVVPNLHQVATVFTLFVE